MYVYEFIYIPIHIHLNAHIHRHNTRTHTEQDLLNHVDSIYVTTNHSVEKLVFNRITNL